MKKVYIALIINLIFFSNSFASMEFKSFEKFNEFYGVGKYCIDGQVFISNFKNRGDGRFVPVGSPTQVFYNGMKRMLPKEC